MANGARKSFNGISTRMIRQEIARRQRRVPSLLRRHAGYLAKAAAIEAQIVALGGRPGQNSTHRRRPKNKQTLVQALQKALMGNTTLRVTDVVELVQKQGYKTTAANFRTIVNQALGKKTLFKKISRGIYQTKEPITGPRLVQETTAKAAA